VAPKPIYALVGNLFFAEKIVKRVKAQGLEARAFDSAQKLVSASGQKEPALVLLDCDGLEKEAFETLRQFRRDARFSKIPAVGFLNGSKLALKQEMRNAGCIQVYTMTEFSKELDTLIARTHNGFSSRI